jgi:branched-chain amino acid transport system permease protein
MVVIGGTGTRFGALIGGVLYTWADQRLGDASSSHAVSSLPSVLRTPLGQPLFVLGVLFILVVFFVPGGIARAGRLRRALKLS